jgi:hypothetical protein
MPFWTKVIIFIKLEFNLHASGKVTMVQDSLIMLYAKVMLQRTKMFSIVKTSRDGDSSVNTETMLWTG